MDRGGKVLSIVSFYFFVFVAVVVGIYYITPRTNRWLPLLLGSAVFIIISSSWKMYIIFLAQVILAYGGAWLLYKNLKQSRLICGIAIALEIGTLIILKDSSFFIINYRYILRLLGKPRQIPFLEIAAPLAVSYYTLMLVSYILDVYWRKIEPEKNPLKLLLYAGFFPQMVAGPIARYSETTSELWEGHRFHYDNFCFGIQRFLWGLFKKLVLAERLGTIVTSIYTGGLEGTSTPVGSYIWIGAVAYVFQLYTDFSGGMDIVLGTAQLFGIVLPENFRTPFYSTSMSELWRRWHITLGLWLKDYIMFPFLKSRPAAKFRAFCQKQFGKKAAKTVPTYLGTFLVWFCCGFWHGGTYKWIFWGLCTFVIIVGGMVLQPFFNKLQVLLRVNTEAESWILFGRLRTFLLFTIACSVQPADSLMSALKMWKNAFVYNPWVFVDGSLYQLGLDRLDFWVMIFGLMVLFVVSKYQQRGSVREIIARQNLAFRWILWIGLLMTILIFGMYGEGYNPADFIYGGF